MIYLITILILFAIVYVCAITYVIVGFVKIDKTSKKQSERNIDHQISVVIPVRNEEKNIVECLSSLQNQNYDKDNFEIIIINDHSTDNTERLIDEFIKDSELNVSSYALSEKTSKKEALKYGIEKSNYDIIATTDGDCIVSENWLKNISSSFNDDTDMLLGPIIFKRSKGFLYYFQVLDMLAIQGVEFGTLHYKRPILNNAANLAYSKSAYDAVDGFDRYDTPSGDDVFLLEKFKSTNKKVKGLLKNNFIVETASEKTLSDFLNQRLRWSSKSKYYKSKLLLFFSLIVLIQNLSLIFISFGIPLVEKYRLTLIILLGSKWLIDFILLFLVTSFYNRNKALLYFIPVQIVYPVYIVIVWIASITMKFEWKGRSYNG